MKREDTLRASAAMFGLLILVAIQLLAPSSIEYQAKVWRMADPSHGGWR